MSGSRRLAHGKRLTVLAVIAWSAAWTFAAPAEEASPVMQQLLVAVREGDLPEVRRLVEEGAYKPTTMGGILVLATAKAIATASGEEVHAEIAALLQAESDERLESGGSADTQLREFFDGVGRRLGERLGERLAETDVEARSRQVGDRFRDCPECPEMTVLPAGEFDMGSPATEQGRTEWEGPRHRVVVEMPVAMSSHEITVSEFAHFVSETGHSTGDACWTFDPSFSERPDWFQSVREGMSPGAISRAGKGWRDPGFSQDGTHPVVCASWHDARAYAQWLSGETGESYRLPSEAEWEYAARAGTSTARYWGDVSSDACGRMNGDFVSCRDDGYRHSSTVGSFEPNGFGLRDMLGNAWEWTADCANPSYRYAPTDGSAWQGGACSASALRGGSFGDFLRPARSALRKFLPRDTRAADVGFRVARSMRTDAPHAVARDVEETRDTGRRIGERFSDCPGCPEMVVVPAGSFKMGSRRREKGRGRDEGPVRDVKIADRLAVGVYEVTRAEFARFVVEAQHTTGGDCVLQLRGERLTAGEDGWRSPGFRQHGSHPVVCVDWHDAKAYTQWLSGTTGKTYRLPSEAEWEYVARAGSTGPRPWTEVGDMRSQRPSWPRQCAYANGADLSFGDWLIAAGGSTDDVREYVASCEDWHIYTAPVGSYRSNRFGLHDIIGNVYEWTEDCRNKNYRRAPTDGSPWTAGDCQYRVGRGGMYFSEPHELRPAKRATFRDTEKLNFLGFRVVRAIAAGQGAGRSAERGD